MDTENFLLTRRELQNRLESRRQQIAFEKAEQDKQSWALPWGSLGPLANLVMDQVRRNTPAALTKGLMTAGMGWLVSKFLPHHFAKPQKNHGFFSRIASLL